MTGEALLKRVNELAQQGLTQKQIAAELGVKSTFTLNNRLVKASQETGKPVPQFKAKGKRTPKTKPVEMVTIKRRGKGDAFGVNVPQEPLVRAGIVAGAKLRVTVSRGKVVLRPV